MPARCRAGTAVLAFQGPQIACPLRERSGLVSRDCLMPERRHFTQTQSLAERLAQEAKRLREEAKSLPAGPRREDTLRKARQAETGLHMNAWLTSPRLQPPD